MWTQAKQYINLQGGCTRFAQRSSFAFLWPDFHYFRWASLFPRIIHFHFTSINAEPLMQWPSGTKISITEHAHFLVHRLLGQVQGHPVRVATLGEEDQPCLVPHWELQGQLKVVPTTIWPLFEDRIMMVLFGSACLVLFDLPKTVDMPCVARPQRLSICVSSLFVDSWSEWLWGQLTCECTGSNLCLYGCISDGCYMVVDWRVVACVFFGISTQV